MGRSDDEEARIDKVLKGLLESTTIHALPRISSSKYIAVKLLWFGVFVGAFVLFVLQLDGLIKEYNSNPKQTTITLRSGSVRFPAITICNMNTVKLSTVFLQPQLNELGNTQAFVGYSSLTVARLDPRRMDVYELILDGYTITEDFRSQYFPMYSYWEMVDFLRNIYYQTNPKQQPVAKVLSMNELVMLIDEQIPKSSSAIPQISTTTRRSTHVSTTRHTTSTPQRRKRAGGLHPNRLYDLITQGPVTGTLDPAIYHGVGPGGNIGIVADGPHRLKNKETKDDISALIDPLQDSATTNVRKIIGEDIDGRKGGRTGTRMLKRGTGEDRDKDNSRDIYEGDIVKYSGKSSMARTVPKEVHFTFGQRVELHNWVTRSRPIFNYFFRNILDRVEYEQPLLLWKTRNALFEAILRQQTREFRSYLGHQFEDLVLSSYFAGIQENAKYKSFWTKEYGNCYTIDSPQYETQQSGPGYGFELLLNLEMDEYLSNIQEAQGLRIVLHQQGTVPFPNAEGITLAPGYEHQIGLKIVETSQLGPPYGNCTDGKQFSDKYRTKYTRKLCMEICKIELYINECGCMPVDSSEVLEKYVDLPVCKFSTNSSVQACAGRMYLKFASASDICHCVEPCSDQPKDENNVVFKTGGSLIHEISVIIDSLCTKSTKDHIKPSIIQLCAEQWSDKVDVKKYRNNFMKLHVYFEDTQYQVMEEEPTYGVVRFLSDIGGTAGLFLGASVLSIVEIVHIVLEIILYLRKRQKLPTGPERHEEREAAGSEA